ncbi:type II toxin-antitoxin system HicB family antitoxin [Ruminococcus sp. HUN007]|uniref:type II toxin-antitoxin system HicB family antitoxin n=1 Tax=Ruminococcus sp. HUN007 TaxID=1514668 RepID=UPI0005D25C1A|nr:type II toxin-antitoxin system HicB family antitoxin [Ruminococcus sp. HUN007]MBR3024491.1 type II toxin-antitoxin system HicB family antitoxin [Oscillospiraceae bacterium]MDY6405412.1 type II toxin-antitoxin system HicB family antitoxin [Synergistales bacterium]
MAKYAYPAVFTAENNSYSVSFPDVEGCLTFGETIPEAIEMAEDALCLMLYDLEEEGSEIPKPSDAKELKVESNEFVTMIACDTVEYRKFYDNKAVKKTLTVPNWMNTLAEKAGINFSQVLQEALTQKLGL